MGRFAILRVAVQTLASWRVLDGVSRGPLSGSAFPSSLEEITPAIGNRKEKDGIPDLSIPS
jgi:hypothetical protein